MFQQLLLIGYLGNDPEMRYTNSGTPVANCRLAVNRSWTASDGQTQSKTTWFNLSFWQRRAEVATEYLRKGSKLMVIGEIEQARPWTDRDGNMNASIEVTVHQFKFLDSRTDEAQSGSHAGPPTNLPPIQDDDIPF